MTVLKYLLCSPVIACAIVIGCGAEPREANPVNGDADDESPQCWSAPEECTQLLECVRASNPAQAQALEVQYGERGSCWCDTTQPEAQACYESCVDQLAQAIEQNPTEPLCHGQYCPIEELDPEQAYGPPIDGGCPDYNGGEQLLLEGPFGLDGSFCSPKCSGVANYCPDHPQTTAEGTCFLTVGDSNYCVARCWVDPLFLGESGTQCQCGAICQPYGSPDGEGNLRGICTYE